jgi:V8-like Glu-specific endopeptidase
MKSKNTKLSIGRVYRFFVLTVSCAFLLLVAVSLGQQAAPKSTPSVINSSGGTRVAGADLPKGAAPSATAGPGVLSPDEDKDRERIRRAKDHYTSTPLVIDKTGQKVVYGEDQRKDIAALSATDPVESKAKQNAVSTCLLTSKFRVTASGATYDLDLRPYQQLNLPPCSNERFREQKVGGFCSGFLVGNDLVATAGHCCHPTDADVQDIAFVFGFFAPAETQTPGSFQGNQVYFGKKVVKHRLDQNGDFAIVQLDRPVTYPGATPLKLRRNDAPQENADIGVVGNPSGLPTKAAFGALGDTKIYEVQPVWLRTNLDTYGGNSGSAVFNRDGSLVEGILVRGTTDFLNHNNNCFYSNRLPNIEAGEWVTRASAFSEFVPQP